MQVLAVPRWQRGTWLANVGSDGVTKCVDVGSDHIDQDLSHAMTNLPVFTLIGFKFLEHVTLLRL